MTKGRKRFTIALVVAGVLIAATVVAARALVPPWLRGTVERVVSEAIGRELKITGPFELSWSLAPTLTAGGITLANAPGGSEPAMVRVERASVSLELASLWSGPVRVSGLEIENARVLLEADGEGRGNWMFDIAPSPEEPPGSPERSPVLFDHVAIRGFELEYRGRPGARPVVLGVTILDATLDPATGMIGLRGAGRFNDSPWEIGGRLGTLDRLYEGRDVDHALAGRIGGSNLALEGRIRDPLALGDPDIEFDVDGPDIEAALANFGLSSPLAGPFRLKGRLSPAEGGVEFDASATLGDVTATARGRVNALLAPVEVDAAVEAAGPDASVAGSWANVTGLPPQPFAVAGRLRLDRNGLSFDGVKIRAGSTSVEVNGVVGKPPRCVGTRLDVTGSGEDLSELSELTRVRLPARPFRIRGRFLRREKGLAIEGVDARIAEASVGAAGMIGEPPRLGNLDLILEASGPDLSLFSELAHVELPTEAFELRGRLARNGPAFDLDEVAARLGELDVQLSGRLVPAKRLEGSEAQVQVAGPDLGKLASYARLGGVPAQPFDARGHVRVEAGGYELDGFEARAGRLAVAAAGHLGAPPGLEGTSLSCRAEGPALSDLEAWGLPAHLPDDPFSVAGNLRVEGGIYFLDRGTAEAAGDRVSLDGTLGPLPDLSRADLVVHAEGPRLDSLGRFFAAAGGEPPERLPAEPYEVSGRARRVPAGLEIRDMVARAGNLEIRAGGTVGSGDGLRGTDLRFDAAAPDTTLLSDFAGHPLPVGPFEAHGRLARVDAGLLCDGVSVAAGGSRASISGTLGSLPKLAGTDLEVTASGADLAALLGPVMDLSSLPPDPFEISGHLKRTGDGLASSGFVARLGESDLEGSVSIRLGDRPVVEADLRSKLLDASAMLRGIESEPETPAREKGEGLISVEPLPPDLLGAFDATLRLEAENVRLPGVPLHDVLVAGTVRDGMLQLDRVEGSGANGARANLDLSLETRGDGYRFRAGGRFEGGRLLFSQEEKEPEKAPSLDVEFDLEGKGRSPHDIAASSDGGVLVILGPGRLPRALHDTLSYGVMRSLLDALNPLSKSSPYTLMECGIVGADIKSGKAIVAPIAAQTDKLTVLGHGKLDFGTEGIELVWTVKPRRGIGLSPGSIANPYIKLGGTLAAPRLDVKPIEATASTGAAVATAGLTVFFRGLYNRITAERKVCVSALAKAREQADNRQAAAPK